MKDTHRVANRLALLEGVSFSPDDLESIGSEIEDLERIVAELEEFAQGTPWISLQSQPSSKEV
jgi:aldehyde:ferredoxin oxidoreductase